MRLIGVICHIENSIEIYRTFSDILKALLMPRILENISFVHRCRREDGHGSYSDVCTVEL